MSAAPRFLTVDDVLVLHSIAIEDQGGDPSIRDRGLLESAVAAPAQKVQGRFVHDDVPAMAAAYAFHICRDHPFLDGNKRAAVAAMIAFLSDHGWRLDATPDEAEPMLLQLASGALDKTEFTRISRRYMREKPKLELRDFFKGIDTARFSKRFLSLLPSETGANPGEFAQRADEATAAMPFMQGLAREQAEAVEAQDERARDRVTMLAVGMLALFCIAEDMGYEW